MVNTPVHSRTTDPDGFFLLRAGKIEASKVQAVADCVSDGFAGSFGIFTNSTHRMNRRAAGYRIETLVGTTLVSVSADVMDDGAVELWESKGSKLINTRSQIEAFDACTTRHLTSTSTWPVTKPGA